MSSQHYALRRPASIYKVVDVHLPEGESRFDHPNGAYCQHITPLILVGTVQKSGAKIYFCPGNYDFCTFTKNGDETETMVQHFATYSEAYRSEDW